MNADTCGEDNSMTRHRPVLPPVIPRRLHVAHLLSSRERLGAVPGGAALHEAGVVHAELLGGQVGEAVDAEGGARLLLLELRGADHVLGEDRLAARPLIAGVLPPVVAREVGEHRRSVGADIQ
eukprot:gene6715-biopygen6682